MSLSQRDETLLNSLVPGKSGFPGFKDISYQVHEATTQEMQAVALAERGIIPDAQSQLDSLIIKYPQIASLYNNRAQCHRLIGNDKEAMDDLNNCLLLLKEVEEDEEDESKGDLYTERQANEQLGWLYFKQNKLEQAQGHFQRAAELGSQEAQRLAIRCNPYAELCNAMFREAMGPYMLFSKPSK